MLAVSGTQRKVRSWIVFVMTALIGLAAMLPLQWRAAAMRVWSYAVYYIGYRVLSLQLSCGSLAVSGVPFVMKHR